MKDNILYITGAGVSAESGIPTFRGRDGFWTVGSENYTPQEMATRQMYLSHPDEFLLWYFKRFASYRHIKPNAVHSWLSDKRLLTQNIDGLDGKAGNLDYIPIHGRLDKVTLLHEQGLEVPLIDAPWEHVAEACEDLLDAMDALEVMEYVSVQHQFGAPLPPLGSLKDEAEWWATRAQRDELQCYLLAIFMALPKQLQLDFTDYAQKYCNERQFL